MNRPHGLPITYGAVTRRVTVQGFRFTYTDHLPGQAVPAHTHDRASVTIPLRGHFVETVEQRRLECEPGAILFKAAGALHENRYSAAGARSLILEVPPHVFDDLRSTMEVGLHVAGVRQGLPWAGALRLHHAISAGEDSAAFEAQDLLAELVGVGREMWTSTSARAPQWLSRARDFLEASLPATPRLADVAAAAGVHPVHLARTFRRHYGCSIGEWTQRARLDRAVTALTRTREPVARIAARLGFHDQPHFTRQFRRASGFTPAAFRRSARGAAAQD